MVINHLSNAIKFTDSGNVTVTAKSEKSEVSEKETQSSVSDDPDNGPRTTAEMLSLPPC